MLDAIEHKLEDRVSHNDLTWPLLDEITLDEVMDPNLRYWTSIRERYRHESAELNLTDQGLSSQLPINWTTVSIHLTAEADSLVLVKHSAGVNPLVFKLPLDRFSRREGEDETFSHSIALAELKEIISSSNLTAQNAKFAKEKDQRAAWWKERKELDARLKLLTETIEDSWLGAFKVSSLVLRRG